MNTAVKDRRATRKGSLAGGAERRLKELGIELFGKEKSPCRLVHGIASLPLGTPVELEVIFEVSV